MPLLPLEHSPTAYRLDFVLYALTCLAITSVLLGASPEGSHVLLVWVLGGAALWSLLEYLLHRFVLHGLRPFSGWHAQHHVRPRALIGTPFLMSFSLFFLLGTVPAWWLLGTWPALAITLGLLASYLGYGLIHHATHHSHSGWIKSSHWMKRRSMWHAKHHATYHEGRHGASGVPCHFGVSSSLWDTVFDTRGAVRTSHQVP